MLPQRDAFENELEVSVGDLESLGAFRTAVSMAGVNKAEYYMIHQGQEYAVFRVICNGRMDKLIKELNAIKNISYVAKGGSIAGPDGVLGDITNSRRAKSGKVLLLVEWPHRTPEWIVSEALEWNDKLNIYVMPLERAIRSKAKKKDAKEIDQWDLV